MHKTRLLGLSVASLFVFTCMSLSSLKRASAQTSGQTAGLRLSQRTTQHPKTKRGTPLIQTGIRLLRRAGRHVGAAGEHFSSAAHNGAKAAGKTVGVFVLPPVIAASAAGSMLVPFGQFFTVPTAVMAVYTPFVLTALAAEDGAHAVGDLVKGIRTLAFGPSTQTKVDANAQPKDGTPDP